MKRIVKLNEKDLHNIVKESVKKVLTEHTANRYENYLGNDMDYNTVYSNAEHAIIECMKRGKYFSDVRELISYLYNIDSFNESDYEIVYDACEDALIEYKDI